MISEDTEQKLAELFAVQDTYRPNESIAQQLANKTMLMFVGATCEGKNTVMEAVAALDKRFAITGNITTRPPRSDDDPSRYTYYEHTDQDLQALLARIERREMVNYAINQHTKYVYTGALSDYPTEYNLGDVVSNAVTGYRQLGFKKTFAFTVITNPAVWLKRFEERFPLGHPQRKARRDEAIESFTWSLAQTSTDHYWVENVDGKSELAAQTVLDVCLRGGAGRPGARKLAEASLEAAKQIQL